MYCGHGTCMLDRSITCSVVLCVLHGKCVHTRAPMLRPLGHRLIASMAVPTAWAPQTPPPSHVQDDQDTSVVSGGAPQCKQTHMMTSLLTGRSPEEIDGLVRFMDMHEFTKRSDAHILAWWEWKEDWRQSCMRSFNESKYAKDNTCTPRTFLFSLPTAADFDFGQLEGGTFQTSLSLLQHIAGRPHHLRTGKRIYARTDRHAK